MHSLQGAMLLYLKDNGNRLQVTDLSLSMSNILLPTWHLLNSAQQGQGQLLNRLLIGSLKQRRQVINITDGGSLN